MTELNPDNWLDKYGDILFRYAVARVRDKSVAEDLVQETLLAAIGAADRFKGDSTEQTWLIGILRHKVLDYLRSLSRERDIQRELADSSNTPDTFDEQGQWTVPIEKWATPEKSLARAEFWQVFNGCLDNLPEPLRTPFALRELDGMETDALIKTLNISTKNNLWVILSRARQRIRQCLQTQWFTDG